MADKLGGWYLNGTTLEYRLFKVDGGEVTDQLSTTVAFSITGFSNADGSLIKAVDNVPTNIQVNIGGNWVYLGDDYIKLEEEKEDTTYKSGTVTLGEDLLAEIASTIKLTSKKGTNTLDATPFETQTQKVAIATKEVDNEDVTTEYLSFNSSKGTIEVKANLTRGFILSGNTATYYAPKTDVTLATISGLRKLTTATDEYKATATIKEDEYALSNDNTGIITLSKAAEGKAEDQSVLGTSDVSIKTETVATTQGINYYLALGDSTVDYEQKDASAYWVDNGYWDYSNTTATYKFTSPIGYHRLNASSQKVDKDGKVYDKTTGAEITEGTVDSKVTKIKYTAAKTTSVVKVTGLAKELENSKDIDGYIDTTAIGTYKNGEFVPGLTVTMPTDFTTGNAANEVTVNVKENVLANSNLVVADGGTKAYDPVIDATDAVIFQLASTDATTDTDVEADIWVIDGSTATYKHVVRTYYEEKETNGKLTQLTYKGQKDLYTMLTIKGLDEDKLHAATKTTTYDGKAPELITEITGLTVVQPEDGYEKSGNKYVAKNSKVGTITIDDALLGESNVTISKSDSFKIKIDDDDAAPGFSNETWKLSGTTATLKGTIKAGYVVSKDGKTVTYTKGGDNQTLATITGLKTGTRLVVDDNNTSNNFADDTNVIGFGNGTSFNVGLSIADNDDTISSNIPVEYNTESYNRRTITVSKNVLSTGKVSIKSSFYDLELDTENDDGNLTVPTAAVGAEEVYWALGTKTSLKKGNMPYYTLAGDSLSINYNANNTNKATLLAEINGLNANVTEGDLTPITDINTAENGYVTINANALDEKNVTIATKNTVTSGPTSYMLALGDDLAPTLSSTVLAQNASNGNVTYTAAVEGGYQVNSTSSTILYTPTKEETTLFEITGLRKDIDENGDYLGGNIGHGVTVNTDNNTVELSYKALDSKNVKLTSSYGYNLVIADDIPTATAAGGASGWYIDKETATFKEFAKLPYYTVGTNTLTYQKASLKGSDITKITGLKSGLVVSDAGSGATIGYYNENGDFTDAVTIDTDAKQITIIDDYVLNKKNVSVTGGYSIAFGGTVNAEDLLPTVDGTEAHWTVKSGTAAYVGGVSGGYVVKEDGKGITYYAGGDAVTIATIKNLPNTVNASDLTSNVEVGNENGIMTVNSAALLSTNTNTKVSLTTAIPVAGGSNYTFALGENVASYDEAIENATKFWSVTGTTATFNTSIESAYYRVGGDKSDYISYNNPGVADKLAQITGLKSGLTAVKGTIRGISEGEGDTDSDITTYAVTIGGGVVSTNNVVITDLIDDDNYKFKLDMGEDVPTVESNAITYVKTGNPTNSINLYKVNSAGFALGSTSTSTPYDMLEYKAKATVDTAATEAFLVIDNLNPTLKSNGSNLTKGKEYTSVDGIALSIDDTVVTLSQSVLSPAKPTITSGNGTLALASDVTQSETVPGWVSTVTGEYLLYSNTISKGYHVINDGKGIEQADAGVVGSPVATVTGLKGSIDNFQIAGISIDGNDIVISSTAVLDGKDIVLTNGNNSGYSLKFANQEDEDASDYVGLSKTTNIWALNNGTATYEQKTTEGYRVDTEGTSIIHTKATTITTTITNLSKEDDLAVDTVGANNNIIKLSDEDAISFNSESGIFTINDEDVLAHKNVTLTTKAVGTTVPKYKLYIGGDIEADKDDPIWNKTSKDVKATLTQKTKAGYTLSDDKQKINYSSDPTTATLATISNLKKEVGLNKNGTIDEDGDPTTFGTGTETVSGLSYALATGDDTVGTITLSKDVLTTAAAGAALGTNDKFEFAFDDGVATGIVEGSKGWEVKTENNTTTATYKSGTNPYYAYVQATVGGTQVDDKKKVTYKAGNLSTEVFNIKGLKKGITTNPDYSIDGLDVDSGKITFGNEVLGSTSATVNVQSYQLEFADEVLEDTETNQWKNQFEWIGNGSTYTYKNYDKAHYGTETNNTITYTPEKVHTAELAKVTGLKSGLGIDLRAAGGSLGGYSATDDSNLSDGGTLILSSQQLNNNKVTLTTQNNFKLALESEEEGLAATIKPDSWTTNKTTATLKGIITPGYTVSEDEKSITYNKTKKTGQTLATVTGLKSGAEISNSDVTNETVSGAETGKKIITLGADQVATSDIKVKGEGYKLALKEEDSLEAEKANPEWVKATGATKATFTQVTGKGFSVEDAGKTLKYYKNDSNNVDLITINGLNSTLEAVDGKIAGLSFAEEGSKSITVASSALAKSAVKLTSKDGDYTLTLSDADNVTVKTGQTFWGFNNGNAYVYQGSTEGWEQDGMTAIKYTKPVTKALATISNLPKNLTFTEVVTNPESNGLSGITLNAGESLAKGGISIYLGTDALANLTKNGNKVTLTNSNSGNYKLGLSSAVNEPEDGISKWTLSNTTATLKPTTTEGFVVGADNKGNPTITYKAETVGSGLATVKGLPKGSKVVNGELYLIDGDTQQQIFDAAGASAADKKIKLITNTFDSGNIALNLTVEGGGYFDLGDKIIGTTGNANLQLYNEDTAEISGTYAKNTFTLKLTPTAGWSSTLSGDNKITAISYKPATTIDYASITGIVMPNGDYSSGNLMAASIAADSSDHIVTIGSGVLNQKNVTMKMGKGVSKVYNFVLDSGVNSTQNAGTSGVWQNQVEWVASGGTANFKLYDKETYETVAAADNSKPNSIKYNKPVDRRTFAAIKGLTKVAGISTGDWNQVTGTVSLGADDLGTSKVTLSINKVDSLTAKEVSVVSTEAAAAINTKIADYETIASNFKLDFITEGDNKVKESTIENAVWDTTGTTAKLVGTVSKGYKLATDKMSITYQSADKDGQEIARITGIKSEVEINPTTDIKAKAGDRYIQVITLGNKHLAASDVKLTGAGYQLSLAGGADSVLTLGDTSGWSLKTDWIASGGTFTYQKYNKAHWNLENNDTTVKYYKAGNPTTTDKYITISGLNKNIATSDVDTYISGAGASSIVSISGGTGENHIGGKVVLGDTAFNKAKITLTDSNNNGYTLADVTTASLKSNVDASTLKFTAKNTAVTIKGTQGKGYLLSNDSQSFTYYSKNTDLTLATINGLKADSIASGFKTYSTDDLGNIFSADSGTFSLGGASALLGDKVTIGGSAKFYFDACYKDASITGSTASDNIKIAGTGISINAGKGNDYVDLGTGSATFFYNSGDGNDVIANFDTDTDKIKLNVAATKVTVAASGSDALVKIDKATLRVKDVNTDISSDIITTDNGTVAVASNVLADDNYSVTPQLSSIVKSTSTYMTDDLVASDATSLTKPTSTAIAYGGDKK